MTNRFFMESARIGFAHWKDNDVEFARALWGDPEVTRLITRPGGFDDEEIRARLALEIENQARFGVAYWPIFEKASGAFVGCCGLRPFRAEDGVFELGFHLMRTHWGKGYASEAGRAVIAHAFDRLDVKELIAGHHPENTASRAVLERLGFCGVGGKLYLPTGLYHPMYSLVRGCAQKGGNSDD